MTTTVFSELCYYYVYDYKGRVSEKQLPGRKAINIVYDVQDRAVLMQDGNLSDIGQWTFIKYDVMNRPILTGRFHNSTSLSAASLAAQMISPTLSFCTFLTGLTVSNTYDTASSISDADIYTISYYDNYSNTPSYFGYSSAAMSVLPASYSSITESQSNETYMHPTGGMCGY